MKDRDFLIWIHGRLECVHKESPLFDYMHKLRAVIYAIPADKETPNGGHWNSMEELLETIEYDKIGC